MADLIQNYRHHTITKDGIVTNTKTGKIKSHWIGANGYYHVDIQEFGKATKVALHRLLAIQYLPNPNNKRTVNHIDGNKLNNNLSNLEWATDSENVQHAHNTGLQPDQSNHSIDFYIDVLKTRFFNGESITSIAKDPSINNTLTQVSLKLRQAANTANLLTEYETELARQKANRVKESGLKKRNVITLQMCDVTTKEVLNTFNSLVEATNFLNAKSSGPISNVISGKQKSAYGYFWIRS